MTAPDADALSARARAACWRGDEAAAREHLDRLAGLVYEKDGLVGWGLPHAWDAFADGSVNPPDTIYAYSTALAGLAFYDFETIIGGGPKYLGYLEAAVQTLVRLTAREGRLAWTWYSDQEADQRDGYQVLNVSALTLELLACVDERRDLQAGLLELLVRDRLTKRERGWSYAAGRPARSDSFHDCFVIRALQCAGEQTLATSAFLELWEEHFPDGVPARTRLALGRYGWGLAMTLLTALDLELAGKLEGLEVLASYVHAELPEQRVELEEPERSLGRARRHAWRELAIARWEEAADKDLAAA